MSPAEKWLFICPAQPLLQDCMIFMETAEKKLFTYWKAKDLSISEKYTFQGTNAFLVLPEEILLGVSLGSSLHLVASFLPMLLLPNVFIFCRVSYTFFGYCGVLGVLDGFLFGVCLFLFCCVLVFNEGMMM